MSKVVIQDAVPFVPNGGQLRTLDARGEDVPIADEEAKKLIRKGVPIHAPNASPDSFRAVLKRLGFAYAEVEERRGNAGALLLRVRTGHVHQDPLGGGGFIYRYAD